MRIKTIEAASNAHHYQLLIKDLLENSLRVNPMHEVVYKDLVRMNYFELYDKIKRLCNLYCNLGLEGGSVIGVIDYDSHRYLMNYFAIPITGNVLHTVNWRLAPEQVLYTINHAEDEVLIVHEDFLPLIESFKDRMETVKEIIVIRDHNKEINTSVNHIGYFDDLIEKESEKFVFPSFSEDAIATLFYTTGTTGNPKAVYFSHRQLVLHTMVEMSVMSTMNEAFKIKSSDVYLPLTPMFHVHAWGLPYLATSLSLKQVYIGKFEPKSFLEIFAKEKPTISHCVPTILNMLLESPAAKNIDLSTWSVLIGGSALSKPLARRALERGISVVTGYGMSETCPLLTSSYLSLETIKNDMESQLEIRTRTGRAALLVDLKVIDEQGNEVPKDGKSLGEIVVRAPYLTMGYYKDKEKGEELWEGGYLHTGDVAWIDENNDVKIVDRSKDVIKTGGEWMSSLTLEEMIGSYEGVIEVAVIGIPDEKWGERPFALVVKNESEKIEEQDLKRHMQKYVDKQVINKWAIPDRFVFVSEIPKTSVGKISKKKIRELYSEQSF
ncbi:fatty acid--CoA ligase [Myroides injenensis]|uniref:fatty acid--CoA ligase n=1 Tax=Myroides injenensis TaxID=1183151 RepID=UPI000289D9DB|nr:fatty acid--CoA ligase [Myroides injenensis]